MRYVLGAASAEIVDAHDFVAFAEKRVSKVGAKKTCRASYQDSLLQTCLLDRFG